MCSRKCLFSVCVTTFMVLGMASAAHAGMVGLWRFEEGTGLTVADSSGYNHTGALSGYKYDSGTSAYVDDVAQAPTFVAGHSTGTALAFSPTFTGPLYPRPVMRVADAAGVSSNLNLTGSFSIAGWIWFNASPAPNNYVTLLAKDASYIIQAPKVSPAGLDFWLWDNNYLTPANPGIEQGLNADANVSTNTWIHVTYTYDQPTTTAKLYINGVENDSQVVTGTTAYPASASDLIVGHDPFHGTATSWQRDFSGKLDDLAMFNEALTPTQVTNVMNGDFSAWPPVVAEGEPVIPASSELLALWRFDEGTGVLAVDSSVNANNGELVGTAWDGTGYSPTPSELPQWIPGKYGTALNFDGDVNVSPWGTQYVYVPYSATLDVGASFTFAAWVRMADGLSNYPHILYRAGSYAIQLPNIGADDNFYFWNDGGVQGIQTWPDTIESTGMAIGQWKHVAFVLSGGTLTSYVDGVATGTSAVGATVPTAGTADGMWIGMEMPWSGYDSPMHGAIDDLAIFSRALTPAELATIMTGDFAAFLPASGVTTIVASLPEGFIQEGGEFTLTAPAGAISYQWRRNGVPLDDDGRITGSTTRTLSFGPVQQGDAGTYTCVYDDGTGKAFIETPPYVLVVLAPGALPVAGLLGLGALALMTLGGGIAARRRR